jgi:hypothetical protein
MDINEKMSEKKILNDIAAIMPEWKALAPEDITLKRMLGITNSILKVEHSRLDVSPKCLIYRLFGSEEESKCVIHIDPFLHRDTETRVFQEIAKAGAGPCVYGYVKEYRLEEYIPSTVLPAKRMLDEEVLLDVASQLRLFHSIEISFLSQ